MVRPRYFTETILSYLKFLTSALCCLECPENFVGIHCEHKLQLCEAGKHLCLHGGKCVKYGMEIACDCTSASTTLTNEYAGASCEHPATDICTVGDIVEGEPRFFCVNGGVCEQYVTTSDDQPGCSCGDQWTGPHCELKISAVAGYISTPINPVTPRSYTVPTRGGKKGIVVYAIVISIFASVVSLILAKMVFSRSRSGIQPSMQDTIDNASPMVSLVNRQPFRDPDEDAMSISFARDKPTHRNEPAVYMGPPIDEDGNELHNVEIA